MVSFLAVLELFKTSALELVQSEPYAPIHVRIREVVGAGRATSEGDLDPAVTGA